MEPFLLLVKLVKITEKELKQYDGSDSKKTLLMAIKGQIYDVSQSKIFYGPGGPYAFFARKDASRALAKMSFEEKILTMDISGFGPFELEALQNGKGSEATESDAKLAEGGPSQSEVAGTNEKSSGSDAKED
ncbi:hypothetical protein REPUB_Repub04eG0173000 [Reevesia pubescens]